MKAKDMKNRRNELKDGTVSWYQHGKKHREDGPAVECADGTKAWYLNDQEFSEEEFNQWLERKNLNENLQSTLDPKLTEKKNKI